MNDNGQVVVKPKRPLQDERRELRFGQVQLLQKLAILIPPWAELLRRVFAIDILKCDQCGGDMKIIAIIPASGASEAILDHLGIDTHHNPTTGPPISVSAA